MSQDECSTEARRYTQGKTNKEGTTRSGATAPNERDYADKAPARQQSTTHKGSKTKSPFCVVLKIYHLNTWILHKTCLKHSNFLNRKILCTWNIMATAMGQGTEETQRVETRFKIQQFQHAPSPDWAQSPNCVQFLQNSGFCSIRYNCLILPRLQIWDREQTRRLLH